MLPPLYTIEFILNMSENLLSLRKKKNKYLDKHFILKSVFSLQ